MSCDITEEEINNLYVGDYIKKNGEIHVKAVEITKSQQMFHCPFCRSKYSIKSGKPTKMAKYTLHNHSFDPNSVQSGHSFQKRLPHCGVHHHQGVCYRHFPEEAVQFCIHVTNLTKKPKVPKKRKKSEMNAPTN